jgi:hypothetical protein
MKKPARLLEPTPVFRVVRPRESLFTLSATQSLAPLHFTFRVALMCSRLVLLWLFFLSSLQIKIPVQPIFEAH